MFFCFLFFLRDHAKIAELLVLCMISSEIYIKSVT